jgi:PleD family two-component response regulator
MILKKHAINVLLIDDQLIISEAVPRMLADCPDIALDYCQNPLKAVQVACDISPTVILLDLVMPEVDGLTLIKFFRANKKTRNIPLIVLSTKWKCTTICFLQSGMEFIIKSDGISFFQVGVILQVLQSRGIHMG